MPSVRRTWLVGLVLTAFVLPGQAAAQSVSKTPSSGFTQGVACTPNGALGYNGNSFVACASGAWSVQPVTIGTASSAPYSCSSTYEGMLYFDTGATAVKYCNGSSWASLSGGGGGGTPAGSNTQVQFNNSGSFGADSNFNWDNTNKRLGIGTSAPIEPLEINASLTALGSRRWVGWN